MGLYMACTRGTGLLLDLYDCSFQHSDIHQSRCVLREGISAYIRSGGLGYGTQERSLNFAFRQSRAKHIQSVFIEQTHWVTVGKRREFLNGKAGGSFRQSRSGHPNRDYQRGS